MKRKDIYEETVAAKKTAERFFACDLGNVMERRETYKEIVAAKKTARRFFACVIVGSVVALAMTGHFNSVASNTTVDDNSLDCVDVQATIGAQAKIPNKCRANRGASK